MQDSAGTEGVHGDHDHGDGDGDNSDEAHAGRRDGDDSCGPRPGCWTPDLGGRPAMSFKVSPGCDGCGACKTACPRGAIQLSDDPRVPYEVTSLNCNDCGKCAIVCRQRALAPDPDWAQCWGRGCPLASTRYEGWSCAEGRRRCLECGNSMWREPDSDDWVCSRCGLGAKVMCPKARKAAADAAAAAPATAPDRSPVEAAGPVPVPVGLVAVAAEGATCAHCADARTPIDAALRVAAPVGD